MRRLGELLEEDWSDEDSDVIIQEAHFHGNEIPTLNLKKKRPPESPIPPSEEVTKPENEIPEKRHQPTLSPRAKRISLLITVIATGIAGAIKIIWEVWQNLPKK